MWQFNATNVWTHLETCFKTEIIVTFLLSWYLVLTHLLRKRRIIEKS